jgi:hypothetical protein
VVHVEDALDGHRRLLLPLLLLVARLMLRLPLRLRLLLLRGRPRLLLRRGLAVRRGSRGLALGRGLLPLLRGWRGAVLFRPVLVGVVLHVDDAALRIERGLDVVLLPLLRAALPAAPAAAAPLPAEPAPPGAALALTILPLSLLPRLPRRGTVLPRLRESCVARLGCIGAGNRFRRRRGTLSFSVHS